MGGTGETGEDEQGLGNRPLKPATPSQEFGAGQKVRPERLIYEDMVRMDSIAMHLWEEERPPVCPWHWKGPGQHRVSAEYMKAVVGNGGERWFRVTQRGISQE
ncbi:RNA-binding motif, single-stranded-interacting protein 3 [Platysternon megacephalum]|uniref:RNA-binding motif, single-stranded-interacting protein 3 n=1 Tax=Platysternon megacephalum TaxID=55544 RepID=A0A4D9EY18_9SAUR|nr:RNA-binding motif, single-stranded-interacting protein 3 [Platysternon megacephalum]